MTFTDYVQGRYFTALDGLRAVAVLMVVLHHMTEKSVFAWLNGYAGVTVFFVLSGFLITTLCVREMDRSDKQRLSLSGFYIKRAFRIIPLYLVALAAYGVLTFGWDLTGTWEQYVDNLPYYLTMNGDLIKDELPFAISWSLGVEEKFYILWPLMLVATRFVPRVWLAPLAVVLVVLDFAVAQRVEYAGLYLAILVGCTLALAMNRPGWYEVVRRVVSVPGFGVGVVALVVVTCASQPHYDGTEPGWPDAGLLAMLFIPAVAALVAYVVVLPDKPIARVLSTTPARWVGDRSYAIYLFHAMTIHVVDVLVAPEYEVLTVALRVALVVAISFAVADLAHRLVERPCRDVGRRIVRRRNRSGDDAQSEQLGAKVVDQREGRR